MWQWIKHVMLTRASRGQRGGARDERENVTGEAGGRRGISSQGGRGDMERRVMWRRRWKRGGTGKKYERR